MTTSCAIHLIGYVKTLTKAFDDLIALYRFEKNIWNQTEFYSRLLAINNKSFFTLSLSISLSLPLDFDESVLHIKLYCIAFFFFSQIHTILTQIRIVSYVDFKIVITSNRL